MNQKFNLLSAFGMILVVGGHANINFLNWFPSYTDFHMQMFIFISGYFFKDRAWSDFVSRKITRLIIPFLYWNLLYGILVTILQYYNIINFSKEIAEFSIKNIFYEPFIGDHLFAFNAPSWFVGTLFFVQMFYYITNKICRSNILGISIISMTFYSIALYLVFHEYITYPYNIFLPLSRALYLVIFYHFGYIYRKYLESKDTFSFNKLVFAAITNGILLGFVNNIGSSVRSMTFSNHNFILPIILACTGIYFYLQIAELLKDKIEDTSIISYIGRHTFAIMTHHLSFFWIFNSFLFLCKSLYIFPLKSFDIDNYIHDLYFKVQEHFPANELFYLIAGIFGPIICCYLYENI